MLDPVAIVTLLVWGTIVGVDLVSFPQAMLNRPIVAASVAGFLVGDLEAGLRVGMLLEVGVERHQEAGGAEPALERVVLVEAALERAGRQPFDRAHVAPVGLHREQQARPHRLAVELHRARPAHAVLAAHLGAGQPLVADEVREERARLDLGAVGRAVDAQGDAYGGGR